MKLKDAAVHINNLLLNEIESDNTVFVHLQEICVLLCATNPVQKSLGSNNDVQKYDPIPISPILPW